MVLHPQGIGIMDMPPEIFQYGLATHNDHVRTFVYYIERLYPDEEAWEALFDDRGRLDIYRRIYGDVPKFPRRDRRRQACNVIEQPRLGLQ